MTAGAVSPSFAANSSPLRTPFPAPFSRSWVLGARGPTRPRILGRRIVLKQAIPLAKRLVNLAF